jgi:hypothetical protein
MKINTVSDLKVCGPVITISINGDAVSLDLRLWADLWVHLADKDLSQAKLLCNTIQLTPDIRIEAEDFLILARFPPNSRDPAEIERSWMPMQAQVGQGFEWEEGFSYTREEVVERDGTQVTLVHVIPDKNGVVPPLYSQPMLASFTDDSKPMEVVLNGSVWYSNVHKWKTGKKSEKA